MIARLIPIEERSRAVSFVFSGLSVGSVLGLLFAPPLVMAGSLYFTFLGILGVAWFLGFQFVQEDQAPFNATSLSWAQPDHRSKSWNSSLEELRISLRDVPWKEFFKSKAAWAMIYAHFCGSWGHYTCLSWLPTFFSEEPNLDLTEAAWACQLHNCICSTSSSFNFVTSIASQLADNLISKGVETTAVRKIFQTIACVSPATCMILSSLDLGLSPWEVVAILTGGLALSSFALSGLYCTHQDISPEYASILLGITNTVGAIPGIVGVALTDVIICSIDIFLPYRYYCMVGVSKQ